MSELLFSKYSTSKYYTNTNWRETINVDDGRYFMSSNFSEESIYIFLSPPQLMIVIKIFSTRSILWSFIFVYNILLSFLPLPTQRHNRSNNDDNYDYYGTLYSSFQHIPLSSSLRRWRVCLCVLCKLRTVFCLCSLFAKTMKAIKIILHY